MVTADCCVAIADCCCEEVAVSSCSEVVGCCGDRKSVEVETAGSNKDVVYAPVVINVGACVKAKLNAEVAALDVETVERVEDTGIVEENLGVVPKVVLDVEGSVDVGPDNAVTVIDDKPDEGIIVSDWEESNFDILACKKVVDVGACVYVGLNDAAIVTDVIAAWVWCGVVAADCCVKVAVCCCEEVAACSSGEMVGCCGDRKSVEVETAGVNEDVEYEPVVINVGASVKAKLNAKVAALYVEAVERVVNTEIVEENLEVVSKVVLDAKGSVDV